MPPKNHILKEFSKSQSKINALLKKYPDLFVVTVREMRNKKQQLCVAINLDVLDKITDA